MFACLLLFVLACWPGHGQDSPYNRIYSRLLSNSTVYNKDVPPWELGHPVNITISSYYMGLISIEPEKQLVKYITMLNMTWRDPRLRWDPQEMEAKVILVPPHTIWKPIINVFNAVNGKDLKELWSESTLQLYFTGRVSLLSYCSLETICGINVEAFPFDEQYCPFSFTSVMNSIDNYRLITGDADFPVITPYSVSIPEWTIHETLAFADNFTQEGTIYSKAQIVFHFRRNSQFYVFLLILPTFLVTSLCIGALLLPIDLNLGEKINLGIAGLLSLTFLLSVMIGELPRTPGLPLMGKWVIVEMFFCFGSLLCPLAIGFMEKFFIKSHRPGGRPLGEFLVFLVVTVANITASLLMFLLPDRQPKPTAFIY